MTCDVAIRFIYSAFSAAMGCIFSCFRIRTDPCPPRTHLVSEPAVSRSRRNASSPNQFTSLLVSEEHDGSPSKDEPNASPVFQQTEISDRDLQYEAKFLKACGILVETPAEIRKSREHLQNSGEQYLGSGSPRFHSWYPNTSVEKLCLKSERQAQSLKPLKLHGEWGDASSSSDNSTDSFISCIATGETDDSINGDKKSQLASHTSSTSNIQDSELNNNPVLHSPQHPSVAVKSRAKSVRFAREPNSRLPCSVEMPGYHGFLEYSPHPTPLKLTDDMQTPGTIYAANLDSATKGRNARIRSQYVYAALNPVNELSQLGMLKETGEGEKEMKHACNDSYQQSDSVIESSENLYGTPGNSSGKENEDFADMNVNVEATLSTWLRPSPLTTVSKTKSRDTLHTQDSGLTPGSRPILGVLPASYLNTDDSSGVSVKGWDGNGIPNTTTKYKEDQKVRWHATPFEERLEKALSVEGSIPDRRHMDGIPIVYEDKEDENTESPILQSSTLQTEARLPFKEHRIDIVS